MDSALVISRLENFEGRVPHMYRCTGGKVTIGIGHAIETRADALNLTWSITANPRPATKSRPTTAASPPPRKASWPKPTRP